MAPPLTFNFALSMPSSRWQARACAANASFNSNRSMRSSVSFARRNALRIAGTGPSPRRGIDAGRGARTDEGDRLKTQRFGQPGFNDQQCRRAVVDTRRIARSHRALVVLGECGFQLAEILQRRVRPRVLVHADEGRSALALRNLDGHDLLGE